jgi:hypothetical protein
MTIQEALKIVFEARGYEVVQVSESNWVACANPHYEVGMLSESLAGLSQFAEILLWAFSQKFRIAWWDETSCHVRFGWGSGNHHEANGTSPQEAFVLALAEAIQARKEPDHAR